MFSIGGGIISGFHSSQSGGAISLKNGKLSIVSGRIEDCSSLKNGGAIYVSDGGVVEISGGEIIGSSSEDRGGAIFLAGKSSLNLSGGKVANNSAKYGGAISLSGGSTFEMTDGKFIDNTALYGGGIYIEVSNNTFNMSGGEISQNTATQNNKIGGSGGGIFISSEGNIFNMSGGSISENKAYDGAGVNIGGKDNAFYLVDGEIQDNEADNSGGGIYVDSGSIKISGGKISRNSSNATGGGLYMTQTQGEMTGGVFSENRAKISGGGIYVDSGSIKISGGKISRNSSNATGGGLYMTQTQGEMTGGVFSENRAKISGGGIGLFANAAMEITAGTIKDNIAEGVNDSGETFYSGGGIYVDNTGLLILKNVAISKNETYTTELTDEKGYGGGFAACPTSEIRIHLKQGGIIYDNVDHSGTADELYIEKGANSRPIISRYYLGGGKYDWTNSAGKYSEISQVVEDYENENKPVALFNELTDNDSGTKNSLQDVKVWITGNKGLIGGGIGANGTVIIGQDPDPETNDLVISNKVSGGESPDSEIFTYTITAEYTPFKSLNGTYGDVKFVDGVAKISLKNGQSVTIKGLPIGTIYNIVQNNDNGYLVKKAQFSGAISHDQLSVASFENWQTILINSNLQKSAVDNVQKFKLVAPNTGKY